MILKYCKRCLYPHTKPDLTFNAEGVCSACTAFDARSNVDWRNREFEFQRLVQNVKELKADYDCVIPVSGGKDSTYQVIKAKEYGLNILAVTATTDHLSDIGRANLNNISRLGVDHMEITTNAQVRAKLAKYTLKEIGDISWAEHVTIFSVPIRIAKQFKIPLIIYGENPQNEYGGPYKAQQTFTIDQRWLSEFGGLNGLRTSDLLEVGLLTPRDSLLYTYPSLEGCHLKGIFLGQYFPWHGDQNAMIASEHGFKSYYGPVEGVGYSYENLDNCQVGIHDYFKYIKFGFGRCTDIASNHIRRKNITRNDAKEIVRMYDGRFPETYLGVPAQKILARIGMGIPEIMECVNKFANKKLFEVQKGRLPKALFGEDFDNA